MSIKSLFTRLWTPADLVEHTVEISELVSVPACEPEIIVFEAPPGDRAWLALTMLGMVAAQQGGMFSPADALAVAAHWAVNEDEIIPLGLAIIEAATSAEG